jgi:prefoldin subunit 5
MDRVLQNTWDNLTITRAFLDEVQPEARALFAALDELSATLDTIEPKPGELQALRDHVDEVTAEATTMWLTIEAGGATPDDITALAARAQTTLAAGGLALATVRQRIQSLIAEFDRVKDRLEAAKPGLEKKVREALVSADRAIAQIDDVRGKVQDLMGIIARGEGSLGKLANDPEFPEDAKELGKILKRKFWRVIGHPQDDLNP